jgi:hypothetical protein
MSLHPQSIAAIPEETARARYIGSKKLHLQVLFTATALNVL